MDQISSLNREMNGENIIILSSDDWASGLKTSKYHIAKQFSQKNQVLFVNSVGLRSPEANARDLHRAFSKLLSFLRGAVRVERNLHVYTPIVVPFRRNSPTIKKLNAMLLRASMRWLRFRLGLTRPIVFAFIPTFNDLLNHMDEQAVVYYCIDELRGYAGVDTAWFDREENRLVNGSTCVISSSRRLHESFSARGIRSYHVPHGVDWALFRCAVDEDLIEPEDMKNIPHPRLGFYGFLSEEWIDYQLLKRVCHARPDWQIVLLGRPRAGMSIKALMPEPNVHFLGLKPFEKLPAYTRHFDVGLIPFALNQLTLSSNPLKLLEYLSGGLPVVTTAIPEARTYASISLHSDSDPDVYVAESSEDFIHCCEMALQVGDSVKRRQRSDRVRRHSWELRAEEIGRIVMTGPSCQMSTDSKMTST